VPPHWKVNMPAQQPRPLKRRDGAGRIDPRYARELLAKARETRNDDDQRDEAAFAFLKGARPIDPLAREMGENVVQSATSGEESEAEWRDRITPEEVGGPFVVTTASLPRTSKAEP
jgi:hypothetical protein